MIVDGTYPNDIRVRKEAESLAENGKKVLVVCPSKKGNKKNENINGVEVFRIGNDYATWKKGLNDIVESLFNINPFFYFGLKEVFKKYKVDFLHVHDLPLASTGFRFKKQVTNSLILDLHENYPEAIKTWFSWRKSSFVKFKNSLVMNPQRWSKKEKYYCEKYDKVICVVQEMKEKLITNFKIDSSKLIVVSNYEKKNFRDNFIKYKSQKVISKKDFSITYVGGFGPHRGLDTCIKAMPSIINKIPNAKLYLIGKGNKDVEMHLKSLVEENNVEDFVKFVGYRPFEEVSAIMCNSSVNIIPHNSDEHTNNTIPHKLFQIMLSEQLLLVSSCKPLKRIVEKYDAGVVFEAGNPNDFSKKVIEIYNNKGNYNKKIENALSAVLEKEENWESESLKLLSLY